MICEQPDIDRVERPDHPDPVTAGLEALPPALGGVGLHEQRLRRRLPQPEGRSPGCFVHDPCRRDRGGGVLSAVQQPRQQLHEDLRLDVSTHRPDDLGQ